MAVETFGVLVEIKDSSCLTHRVVFVAGLTADRLVEEVLLPYQQGGSLLLDGRRVPNELIERAKLVRIPSNLDQPFRSIAMSPGSALQSDIARAVSSF